MMTRKLQTWEIGIMTSDGHLECARRWLELATNSPYDDDGTCIRHAQEHIRIAKAYRAIEKLEADDAG